MKKWRRALALLLALCMTGVLLTGCDEDPNDEDKLSVVLTGDFTTMDPAMATTTAERTVVLHLFDNLLRWDGTEAVAAVAQSWQCEDNEDGTQTYTFHLRSDAKWSDGSEVTAGDFAFAWRRLVSPDTASPNAELLSMVAGYEEARAGDSEALQVSAQDKHTFVVTLSGSCAYFVTSVCTASASMPVQQSAVTRSESWSIDRASFVGNGPFYRGGDWTDNSRLTLQKQETHYSARRVTHDRVELVLQNREQAAKNAGRVDVVIGAAAEGAEALNGGDATVGVLLINQMATSMERDGLRQALALAIDRNALADTLGVDYVAAQGLVPGGIRTGSGGDFRTVNGALLDNDPDTYDERCTQALTLLHQAGYTSSASLASLGTVTLLYDSTAPAAPLARLLQQTWREKLGIAVTLEGVNTEDYQQRLVGGEFTLALTELTALCNDAEVYLNMWCSGHSRNYALLHKNAYDILLRVAADSSSQEARDAYLKDAEQLLLEGGYVIPLYGREQPCQLREGVTGAVCDGLGAWYFGSVAVVTE